MMLADEWGPLIDAVRIPPPEPVVEADSWDRIVARRAAETPTPTQTIVITGKRATAQPVATAVTMPSDPWRRIETRRAAETFSHAKTPPWPLIMAAAFGGLLLINALNEKAPS